MEMLGPALAKVPHKRVANYHLHSGLPRTVGLMPSSTALWIGFLVALLAMVDDPMMLWHGQGWKSLINSPNPQDSKQPNFCHICILWGPY